MAELIDRGALKEALLERGFYPAIVKGVLESAPTVDAVEVVRCRDCKYGDWDSKPDDAMVCMRTKDGFWRSGNDFCSFGKRKDGDGNAQK